MALEEVVAAAQADIAARASLSGQAGPCVLLFTFLNTGHSLSCASFASDASHVAGAALPSMYTASARRWLAEDLVPSHTEMQGLGMLRMLLQMHTSS